MQTKAAEANWQDSTQSLCFLLRFYNHLLLLTHLYGIQFCGKACKIIFTTILPKYQLCGLSTSGLANIFHSKYHSSEVDSLKQGFLFLKILREILMDLKEHWFIFQAEFMLYNTSYSMSP